MAQTMSSVVNEPRYLPSTLVCTQSTPMSLYHEKTWRQGTNFRQRQNWRSKKNVLGWLLDTWCLLVQLPKSKFMAWTNLIKMVIQQGTTTTKEVKSIIGRLGHLRMAIPFVHHFLSRLCDLQVQAKSRQSIPITNNCWRDLELMINIIKIMHNGISMNIIAYRHPTHIYLFRFLSGRPWGIQLQQFCLAILPQTRTSVLSNK